jgi:O-antigen/teichoic acid export membrane protein
MLGKQKTLFYTAFASLLVSIIANLIFTLNYGVVGAVISFSITILFTSFQRAYYIKKHFSYKISFLYPLVNLLFAIILIQAILYYVETLENIYKQVIISNCLLILLIIIIFIKNISKTLTLIRFLGIKRKFSSLQNE